MQPTPNAPGGRTRTPIEAAWQHPWLAGAVGVVGVGVIGLLDWATGTELAFSAFYLVPIGYATWFGRQSLGVAIAALSAIVYPLSEAFGGHVYASNWIPAWNAGIRFLSYFVVVALLTSLLRELAAATARSHTDALTGLVRSNRLMELLDDEIQRSRRYDHPFSAVYLDVDDFKEVNDTLGHAAGDDVLRSVGSAMQRSMRATDVCARVGGDEFFVLMPETDAASAQSIAERLQRELKATASPRGTKVTFSIGVVTFERPPTSADAAVSAVDELMYAVKRGGKDGFRHAVAGERARAP